MLHPEAGDLAFGELVAVGVVRDVEEQGLLGGSMGFSKQVRVMMGYIGVI